MRASSNWMFWAGRGAGFHDFSASLVLSSAKEVLDFSRLCVALVLQWHAFQCHRSLWCLTGHYMNSEHVSHGRGARLVCWLAKISNVFLRVFAFCGSCRFLVCASLLWCFTCYHLNDSKPSEASHASLVEHVEDVVGRVSMIACLLVLHWPTLR